MLPSYYEYYNPVKILSGKKALENLPSELAFFGVCRPLIVTDQGVTKAGLVKLVKKSVADSGMTIGAIFNEVPEDSSSRIVNKIAGIFRKNKCDCLVAIGGGSVIDTAKGVNILVTEESDDLMAFAGAEMLTTPMKPLAVIPTTSGTGSEVTGVAVISDPDRNVKMAFTSNHLLPKLALLDPRMTLTLPPAITAATGMDALSHAVEACLSLQKNPMSSACAFAAIELIRGNLVEAVKDGKDPETRLAMANAAVMAGVAFSNSMVGVVHALGHAAGAIAHIPHGVAMNIFLPLGLEYNFTKCEMDIARLLLPVAGPEIYTRTPESRRARKTIAQIRGMQKSLRDLCDLPMSLQLAGVSQEQLPMIADLAINDPALIMNPREMEKKDAVKLLNQAF